MSENDKICLKNLIDLSNSVSKHCVGMEGNISGKIGDNFFIKASGSYLNSLSENDLVMFDFNGNQLNNFNKRGSMELSFHSFLLKNNDINFVSHTHPSNTLKVLCSDRYLEFSNRRIFPDQVIFNGSKSCVVPYAKPGEELTNKIKEKVKSFIKENDFFPKLILLLNHGIIACGSTIQECSIITDICEKSAEIYLGSTNINFLTNQDVISLLNDDKEKYRKSLI
jgi:L-fuculose-phosphate aldolase